MSKNNLKVVFFLVLFSIVAIVQYFYDNEKTKITFSEPVVFSSKIVKIFDLGLHNTASDLIWLTTIQYVGGGESKNYEKLDDYLFLSTDLDPNFSYPYAFGAIVLPTFDQTDKGIELAQKGVDLKLPDWKISYYLATIYYLDKNDPDNAAKYFDIAANTKGAPENIQKMAANFGSKKDKREQTKQIWTGIYDNSKDEVVKERAKNYVVHLEILDLLDQASEQYKKIYGSYPTDISQLISGKILRGIPSDPFGYEFIISENGKSEIKY